MKKLTRQEAREALTAGDITVKVGSWSVKAGKHKANEWTLECSEGKFRRSTTTITCWHRWVGSKHPSSDRAWQSPGHWRRCGYRQEEQLDMYFSEAHKLGLIEDRYANDQNKTA